MRRWLWKPLPTFPDRAIKPVLIGLPIIVFLLFVLLIRGLSAAYL